MEQTKTARQRKRERQRETARNKKQLILKEKERTKERLKDLTDPKNRLKKRIPNTTVPVHNHPEATPEMMKAAQEMVNRMSPQEKQNLVNMVKSGGMKDPAQIQRLAQQLSPVVQLPQQTISAPPQ